MTTEVKRSKRPARTLICDGYVEKDGDVEYRPHAGEWVKHSPHISAEDMDVLFKIANAGAQFEAVKGDSDEDAKVVSITSDVMDAAYGMLARHIRDWNLTGDDEQPLPKPDGTTGPIRKLTTTEVLWLVTALARQTREDRKNGSRPSPTTS